MEILNYYIWDIVGIDIDESEREEFEAGFAESAWYKFLAEDLEKLLTSEEYSGLIERFNSKDLSKEQFTLAIKQKLASKSIDFEQKMEEELADVLKMFVSDQIDLAERNINDLQDPTEKTLKTSFIKNLRELFAQQLWDQMGEIFKKINNYPSQNKLVTSF